MNAPAARRPALPALPGSRARLAVLAGILALSCLPARRLDLALQDLVRYLRVSPGPSSSITLIVADSLSDSDERLLRKARALDIRSARAEPPSREVFEGALHRRMPAKLAAGKGLVGGPVYIDWRGSIDSGGFLSYDLELLRKGLVPADAIRGRLILHGPRSTGAAELLATPIGSLSPLEYEANVGQCAFHGRPVRALPLWLQATFAVMPLGLGARAGGRGFRAGLALAAGLAVLLLASEAGVLAGLYACTAGWIASCFVRSADREAQLGFLLSQGRAADVLELALPGEEHVKLRALVACGRFDEVEPLLAIADLRRIPPLLGGELAAQLEAAGHDAAALVLLEWGVVSGESSLSARAEELRGRKAGLKGLLGIEGISRLVSGRYTKLEFLGQGGMGIVLRGWDTFLERPVALKVLSPNLLSDPTARARFRREVETMMRLNHPNIVEIHAVHSEELLYFAMELLEGRSVNEALAQDPAAIDRLAVLLTVADCMRHCHEQGVMHRDLKPDNVLLLTDGRVKLIDFGIARAIGETDLTVAGDVVGTLGYLAPELFLRGKPGPKTDLFAFGVLTFELYTGHLPFAHPLSMGLVMPPPGMPPEVTAVMLRCLAKEPDERPASFAEVLEQLRAE